MKPGTLFKQKKKITFVLGLNDKPIDTLSVVVLSYTFDSYVLITVLNVFASLNIVAYILLSFCFRAFPDWTGSF